MKQASAHILVSLLMVAGSSQAAAQPADSDTTSEQRRSPALMWTGITMTVVGGSALIAGVAYAMSQNNMYVKDSEEQIDDDAQAVGYGVALAGTGVLVPGIVLMVYGGDRVPMPASSGAPGEGAAIVVGPRSVAIRGTF